MSTVNDYSISRDAEVVPLIDLATAKQQLAIASSILEFDTLITGYIKAATEFIEDQTNHIFKSQAFTFVRGSFPASNCSMYLPMSPVVSVNSFNYIDAEGNTQPLVEGTDFSLASRVPGRIDPLLSWPGTSGSDAVIVKYTAGYAVGLEPTAATQAVQLMVANWFMNRTPVVTGTIATDLPLSVQSLINSLQTGQDFIGF